MSTWEILAFWIRVWPVKYCTCLPAHPLETPCLLVCAYLRFIFQKGNLNLQLPEKLAKLKNLHILDINSIVLRGKCNGEKKQGTFMSIFFSYHQNDLIKILLGMRLVRLLNTDFMKLQKNGICGYLQAPPVLTTVIPPQPRPSFSIFS